MFLLINLHIKYHIEWFTYIMLTHGDPLASLVESDSLINVQSQSLWPNVCWVGLAQHSKCRAQRYIYSNGAGHAGVGPYHWVEGNAHFLTIAML